MSFTPILQSQQRINSLARSLVGRPAFGDVHVLIPSSNNPETGFIRATSWLYCLYIESGRVSLVFLSDVGKAVVGFDHNFVKEHFEAVRALRTELHHNLGFRDSDLRSRLFAESWRRTACGTVLPNTEELWSKCYNALVVDAEKALNSIELVIRHIESDESYQSARIAEWDRRLSRVIEAARFDPIIEDAKLRVGKVSLDTVKFRTIHLEKWRKELDLLEDGYDFYREATLLVEKTLIDEGSGVLPITGKDVMEEFSIEPGYRVGELLKKARAYYGEHGGSKKDILEYLHSTL